MQLPTLPVRELLVFGAGYALGCFSSGYYLVRWHGGGDLRRMGSGSTGSTNAGRVLGRSGFILTLAADSGKGALAMGIARLFAISGWGTSGAMAAVMMGHIWPAQLRFQGGKGLATELGIVAVLDYRLALISGSLALLGLGFGLGKTSLLAASLLIPPIAALLGRSQAEITGLVIVTLLVLWAHRQNIRTFFAGRNGGKGMKA